MQQQLIFLFHAGKNITVLFQGAGQTSGELGKAQLRSLHHGHYRKQALQIDRAFQHKQFVFGEVEAFQQKIGELAWAALAYFQFGGGAETAAVQFPLQGTGHIFHFDIGHFQVGVSGNAELVAFDDIHAREKLLHIGVNDRGQKDEIVPLWHDVAGNLDQSGQGTGRRYDGQTALATEGILALKGENEVETLVHQAGKRVGRVKTKGADHR